MLDFLTDSDFWRAAPPWIGAAVAVLVARYSIPNVKTALKAYEENSHDKHIAQARLVWGEVSVVHGRKEGSVPGRMGRTESDLRLLDSQTDYKAVEVDGKPEARIAHDLTIFKVTIVNNSKEPIGNCQITLMGSRHYRAPDDRPDGYSLSWEHSPRQQARNVLRPESEAKVLVTVPIRIDDLDPRDNKVKIWFTDSVGQRWSRINTKKPIQKRRPKVTRRTRLKNWLRPKLIRARRRLGLSRKP